jgi:putative hydrolase of the HAD superfamily
MAMKLRAVFFDLDDTLYPAEATYEIGLRAVWRELSRTHPMSWARFRVLYLRARNETKKQLRNSPVARNRILYLKRIAEIVEGRSVPRLAQSLIDSYNTCWKSIDPRPAQYLAKEIGRKYRLGIVTNQLAGFQLAKLNRIDPDGRFFPILVTSEEMGAEKPARSIFLEACRRAGCRPSEAVVVGNSWKDDVLGAKRAGLRAVYLHLPGAPRMKARDVHVIRSLNDLPDVLVRIDRA